MKVLLIMTFFLASFRKDRTLKFNLLWGLLYINPPQNQHSMFVVTLLQEGDIREALQHCQKSMSELLGKILGSF